MCQFLFHTLGDSSSTLGLVAGPLILLFCYCCVRIRPPQFLTEDSSIVFFVVVLSTVSGQIRLL